MGMPEESEPTDYRKDVIMKKHRIISIALSVIGYCSNFSSGTLSFKRPHQGLFFLR